ncbi:serine hydrolase domain-containing protein [Nonomuraea rhodomycinica]|uniref:Beta-lactamase family protein n=1 Tax=Nonomuraea rhodomycinica TaxID=1712872 RepID=A0A7Y6IM41_9ACTN|nr:serine hydrolase domain-containing protein [Nonomuraea rhodomycinica]NUW40476.1 beta-lactamase family protein [Nonomuraea rhodomycinica]
MDRRRFLALTGTAAVGAGLATAGFGPVAQAASYPFADAGVPAEAHTKTAELAPYGITAMAFTPSNGWVVVTQDGRYFARGIPDACFAELGRLIKGGTKIHCVAFPPEGGDRWVITGDKGMAARGLPEECHARITASYDAGRQVVDVAFPPAGGNRWTVADTGGFYARGIDDECYQMMRNLTQGGRRVTRVAFPKAGGWAVVAQDEFHVRGIDDACFQKLNDLASGGWQLHNLAFSPTGGWSVSSRGKVPALPADRVRQVENAVGGATIWQRMSAWKTPGVAVAVVVGNKIAWSTGYGWLEAGSGAAAHPETAFQAASISKAVASVGVMRLMQTLKLPLTTDVRPHLGWTLTSRDCVSATAVPTVDRLLTHRAGVIGRGSTSPADVCSGFVSGAGGGFAGYGPDATVPTLLQVMNGEGNSPKIELTTDPGAEFHYSGAGFVLLQRMLEQKSGLPLAQYMDKEVFAPLGMKTSSYALSPGFELAAGHTASGAVIPGKRNRYPESAAAGLYTTVQDLCRLVSYLNRAYTAAGDIAGPLTRASVRTLLTKGPEPTMGRGLFLSGAGTSNFSYTHDGSNYGFKSVFKGYPALGAGYAVLSNGNNMTLVNEIASAIRSVYGWA